MGRQASQADRRSAQGPIQELVREVFWPEGPLGKVGRFIGGLSMLALAQHGLQLDIGPTARWLLEHYERLLNFLFGWAEPFVEIVLARLKAFVGWDLMLYPHWKQFFVLMGVYLEHDAQGDYAEGWRGTAAFSLLLGLLVAAVASIAAGTMQPTGGDLWTNFLIAAIPIVGMFIYDVIYMAWAATFLRDIQAEEYHEATPTWWGDIAAGLPWLIGRTVGGLALLWLGLQLPLIQQSVSPGLVMFAVLVFALALYWLVEAALAVKQLRTKDETWRGAYWRTGTANLGAAMLGAFLWGGVTLLAGAGFDLVGV